MACGDATRIRSIASVPNSQGLICWLASSTKNCMLAEAVSVLVSALKSMVVIESLT